MEGHGGFSVGEWRSYQWPVASSCELGRSPASSQGWDGLGWELLVTWGGRTAGEMTKAGTTAACAVDQVVERGVEGNSEWQWLRVDTQVLELAHDGTLTLIQGAQEEWDLLKFTGESPGGPGVKKTQQFYSGGPGSIPDLRTKILQALRCSTHRKTNKRK